ncbi:MAG TPA: efflux RND transporter periplasmic adaptor subunit [Bacteroidota bacterium]|nr:efflux RND transporter periplasmic adaptor subunit [Bacteroidota bacterium]
MKKVLIYSFLVIILAVAVYFLFFNDSGDEYSFRVDKVSSGDMTVYVTATGTINAVTTVEVGSQVSGTISKLYADFNSIVKEGQIIAQIDPTNLQQALNDAEANLERVKAQYNESERTFERIKSLYEKKLESQANYDAALTNYEVSKASLKQAQAQLERAKINLAYATIYAPVNGVVIDRKVNVGQTVAASFSAPTLFTIANDLRKMQVQATIDESDIGKIAVGQEATFTVDAYPDEKFYGKVSQIRLSPVIISNVVNYTVVIDFNNDDLKLMPGMTANIKILVAKKDRVIRVPNIALRFQPPNEVIDTIKMNEMRESFRKAFSNNESNNKDEVKPSDFNKPNKESTFDNSKKEIAKGSGEKQSKEENKSVEQKSTFGGKEFSQADREKFRKLRDSIVKAHGGNLSQEEIFAEFRKAMARREQQPAALSQPSTNKTGSVQKFDIIQSYPQYQKNFVALDTQKGRGRIWIKNSKGKLEPIFVRTGLNDGQYTEIITDKLKEGDEIIIGVVTNSSPTNQQTRNPLTGSQPQPGGGMRPR